MSVMAWSVPRIRVLWRMHRRSNFCGNDTGCCTCVAGAVSGVFLFSLAVERGVNGAYGEILCCFTPAREEFYRIRINTHYTHVSSLSRDSGVWVQG